MITRIWHGWTTPQNATKYEKLLKTEVFPSIENKNVMGLKNISLLKRPGPDEVGFIVMMLFEDIEAVKEFAGEEYENAYIPEKAKKILSRFDSSAEHFELVQQLDYGIKS